MSCILDLSPCGPRKGASKIQSQHSLDTSSGQDLDSSGNPLSSAPPPSGVLLAAQLRSEDMMPHRLAPTASDSSQSQQQRSHSVSTRPPLPPRGQAALGDARSSTPDTSLCGTAEGVHTVRFERAGRIALPARLHDMDRPAARLHDMDHPAARLHDMDRPAARLHDMDRPAARLHDMDRPAARLHDMDRPAARLHDMDRPAARLHDMDHPAARLHDMDRPAARLHDMDRPAPDTSVPLGQPNTAPEPAQSSPLRIFHPLTEKTGGDSSCGACGRCRYCWRSSRMPREVDAAPAAPPSAARSSRMPREVDAAPAAPPSAARTVPAEPSSFQLSRGNFSVPRLGIRLRDGSVNRTIPLGSITNSVRVDASTSMSREASPSFATVSACSSPSPPLKAADELSATGGAYPVPTSHDTTTNMPPSPHYVPSTPPCDYPMKICHMTVTATTSLADRIVTVGAPSSQTHTGSSETGSAAQQCPDLDSAGIEPPSQTVPYHSPSPQRQRPPLPQADIAEVTAPGVSDSILHDDASEHCADTSVAAACIPSTLILAEQQSAKVVFCPRGPDPRSHWSVQPVVPDFSSNTGDSVSGSSSCVIDLREARDLSAHLSDLPHVPPPPAPPRQKSPVSNSKTLFTLMSLSPDSQAQPATKLVIEREPFPPSLVSYEEVCAEVEPARLASCFRSSLEPVRGAPLPQCYVDVDSTCTPGKSMRVRSLTSLPRSPTTPAVTPKRTVSANQAADTRPPLAPSVRSNNNHLPSVQKSTAIKAYVVKPRHMPPISKLPESPLGASRQSAPVRRSHSAPIPVKVKAVDSSVTQCYLSTLAAAVSSLKRYQGESRQLTTGVRDQIARIDELRASYASNTPKRTTSVPSSPRVSSHVIEYRDRSQCLRTSPVRFKFPPLSTTRNHLA